MSQISVFGFGSTGGGGGGGGTLLEGTNYLFVNANGTPKENGDALRATYALAQAMTPNGNPLSIDNRVIIYLSAGYYDMQSSFYGNLFNVNTSYIDLISLSGEKDVFLTSILVESTSAPTYNGINVRIVGIDTYWNGVNNQPFYVISRGDIYPDEFIHIKNCQGGDYSFSCWSSGFNGIYENCQALNYSFCAQAPLFPPAIVPLYSTTQCHNLGTIKNCTAVGYSFVCAKTVFGNSGDAANYGTIENCKLNGGSQSFVFSDRNAYNVGIISNCDSNNGNECFVVSREPITFGGFAQNFGKIINCLGDSDSFVNSYNGSSLTNTVNTGYILDCTNDSRNNYGDAFVTNPVILAGSNQGRIERCTSIGGGFCSRFGENLNEIMFSKAQRMAFCMALTNQNTGKIMYCVMPNDALNFALMNPNTYLNCRDNTGVIDF